MLKRLLILISFIPTISIAQLNNDFEDTNISKWTQSTAGRWAASDITPITGAYSLHHTFDNPGSGKDQISIALPTLNMDEDTIIWKFRLLHGYNPSSSNNWSVFLMSDANAKEMYPSGSANGYALGVNYTGSTDILKFWKITSGSASELFSTSINWQTDVGTSKAPAIEVIRAETGEWKVSINIDGDFNNLTEVGSGIDNSYTFSDYFGIYYEYSSSQDQQLWIDDIEVIGDIYTDNSPPLIDTLEIISPTQLKIEFNEPLDSAIAINSLNYNVDGGIENPDSISIDAHKKFVELYLPRDLTNKEYYNITIRNIEDGAGNILSDTTIHFLYFEPEAFDIVINEIMADPTPKVNLPEYEYIEIFNTSGFDIDLSGWKLKIGSTIKDFPDYILDSAAYAILCSSSSVDALDNYGSVIEFSSLSITNSGTPIVILDELNNVIDTVNFTDSWYQDPEKDEGGWALERIDPFNTCSTLSNWKASTSINGGTPGTENSIFESNINNVAPQLESVEIISNTELKLIFNEPVIESAISNLSNYSVDNGIGNPINVNFNENLMEVELKFSQTFPQEIELVLSIENMEDECGKLNNLISYAYIYYEVKAYDIVINEIMAEPEPALGLPGHEYIEVFNTSGFDIGLSGWKLKIGSTFKDFPDYILDSAEYAILSSSSAVDALGGYGNVIEFSSLSLTNSGTSIIIFDELNNIIDSINYSDDWYQNSDKEEGGWSIERIDPLNTCSTFSNWKASTNSNGGTPGKENSVFTSNIDNESPQLANVEIISDTQLRIVFDEPVKELALIEQTNYSINNGIGNPMSVFANDDFQEIELVFSTQFPQETELLLSIENMIDECGNTGNTIEYLFTHYEVKPYNVVINEIMADPEPSLFLPEYEYIELYNTTDYNLSLNDWTLAVGSSVKTISLGNINSGDYIILCDEDAEYYFQGYGNVLSFSNFPSLGNSEQTLTLRDSEGKIISNILYTDEWYQDEFKAEGGWSLEQIDPLNPCGGENNWIASVNENGGTPGIENSVNNSNPDEEAPKLERVIVIDENNIQLFFDEPLDSLSAMLTSLYKVDQGIGSPDSISLIDPDYIALKLYFDNNFKLGAVYILEILGGLTDCAGNEINEHNSSKFSIPELPARNDLVINEILFNPLPDGFDFIEIYNRSEKTIDLKEILIASYDDEKLEFNTIETITGDGHLIFPQDYIVITEDSESVQLQYMTTNPEGFINVDDLPGYNDDKGRVILLDRWQNEIDNLGYDEDMHFDLLATIEGVSLERINYDRDTDDKTNWHSASELVGFATPGYENSQYMDVGDIEDEVSVEPEIFSPDNDGFEDFANISFTLDESGYVANIKIFDSKGRLVRYLANNQLLGINGVISWDGLDEKNQKAPVGIYVVFIEIFDLDGNVKQFKESVVVGTKW